MFANRLSLVAAVSALALVTACSNEAEGEVPPAQDAEQVGSTDYGYDTYSDDNLADTMASNDEDETGTSAAQPQMPPSGGQRASEPTTNASAMESGSGDKDTSDNGDGKDRQVMQAQVVLDRVGFGPGVIDGKMGMSTQNALSGFQEANDLKITGKLDEATKEALSEWNRIPATRMVTIPASWAETEYTEMPDDVAEKAKLERLGYKSIDERLAERFHTTVEVLRELNSGGSEASDGDDAGSETGSAKSEGGGNFRAGQEIRVPNIGGDRIAPGAIENRDWQRTLASLGVGTEQPEVDRIVVSKSKDTLRAYQGDKLVALFTVSSGSSEFPLPLGEWDILGKAFNPPYSYDPEVLSGGKEAGKEYTLAPGPNSPVGVVWIDLSKEHYGIHGTPDPETIGRAQSSGCVRLTNWDAARLSQMVSTTTQVIFEA